MRAECLSPLHDIVVFGYWEKHVFLRKTGFLINLFLNEQLSTRSFLVIINETYYNSVKYGFFLFIGKKTIVYDLFNPSSMIS